MNNTRKRDRDAIAPDPRSCSYCIKRLFQQTLCCVSASMQKDDDDDEQQKVKEEARKKPPRPLNSYLKIVLDDGTMDRLHEIAVTLRKDIQSKAAAEAAEDEVKQESGESEGPRKGKKRPLRFRCRSRNSLHLTFFFGGEVLCAMPSDELTTWHSNIAERLAKSNFLLDSNPVVDTSESIMIESSSTKPPLIGPEVEKEEYWFRITKLSLFPPRRNPYLIVALLEASPAWHTLHTDIRNVALDGNSEKLKDLAARDKGGVWIPHITLGNLYGGNKQDTNALRTMLQDYPLKSEMTTQGPEADNGDDLTVKCITMGGPVPQVELDWNFQNRNQRDDIVVE